MADYPSEICKYCRCTNYGTESCESISPISGIISCEGVGCQEAYEECREEWDVAEYGEMPKLEDMF